MPARVQQVPVLQRLQRYGSGAVAGCVDTYGGDVDHGFCVNTSDTGGGAMCWEHPCGVCGGPPIPIEDYARGKAQYLMIGDSVSLVYFAPVNDSLSNSSNIQTYHPPINCGDTSRGQECIVEWLGADPDRWDVITYNFGMWNVGPSDCNLSKRADGHYVDSGLDKYIAQLTNLTAVLQSTKAGRAGRVLFVNTSPTALVPECCDDPSLHLAPPPLPTQFRAAHVGTNGACPKRIDCFNEAARAMLGRVRPVVPIIDLYGWATKRCGDPRDWHYNCDIIPQWNCSSTGCGQCADGRHCLDPAARCVNGQCVDCRNCKLCQLHPSRWPTPTFMSGADYLSIPIVAAVKSAAES